MKKLLITLSLLLTSIVVSAQINWYRTTEFAIKFKEYDAYIGYYWSDWTDWERCELNVTFDLSRDIITIYSKETQIYRVLYTDSEPYDSNGKQVKFKVRDQDGDYGHVRLRVQNNGASQIYVDFNDVKWVYNVYRVR